MPDSPTGWFRSIFSGAFSNAIITSATPAGPAKPAGGRITPMRRPRFQLRLSTLLWITLAVACWFGVARYFPTEAMFIAIAVSALVVFGISADRLVPSRPQFSLRSLFIVTAIVAVVCWVGPPAWRWIRPPYVVKEGHWIGSGIGLQRTNLLSDGTKRVEWLVPDEDGQLARQSSRIVAPDRASPPNRSASSACGKK